MQTSCQNSLDKALETVRDLSIALACNLQLAMRDSILKICAPHLHEHDFNCLRRTGFKAGGLFCPTTLDQIQKKHKRSPKRQKMEPRQSFQSKRHGKTGILLGHKVHTLVIFAANRNNKENLPTSLHPQDVGKQKKVTIKVKYCMESVYSTSGRYGKIFFVTNSCANLKTGL